MRNRSAPRPRSPCPARAYRTARRSRPPVRSALPWRTNATGVRSTIATRTRFGSSRITVACSTHGRLSNSARRCVQRDVENIAVHILAKHAQQLRPRQVAVACNLDRLRIRHHKMLIVQHESCAPTAPPQSPRRPAAAKPPPAAICPHSVFGTSPPRKLTRIPGRRARPANSGSDRRNRRRNRSRRPSRAAKASPSPPPAV